MSNRFLGGKTTVPEVDQLIKQIVLQDDLVIPYSEIERITGVQAKTNRFRSVLAAWRKRLLREYGRRIEIQYGAIIILSAQKCVSASTKDMTRLGRAAGRTFKHASLIDQEKLSNEDRAKALLLVRESQAMLDHARRSAKAIAGPGAVSANLRLASG